MHFRSKAQQVLYNHKDLRGQYKNILYARRRHHIVHPANLHFQLSNRLEISSQGMRKETKLEVSILAI